jgi:hypothetical protein
MAELTSGSSSARADLTKSNSIGADLMVLDQLDLKLWAAARLPHHRAGARQGRPSALIDSDKDGRVRAPGVDRGGSAGPAALLKECRIPWSSGGRTPLPAGRHPGMRRPKGKTVLASAPAAVLTSLGEPTGAEIPFRWPTRPTRRRIFGPDRLQRRRRRGARSDGGYGGPGRVRGHHRHPRGLPDRSGKAGLDQAKIDAFFAEATAYEAWAAKAETDAATILPLGDATAAASAAFKAVKTKVDDYFGRCRLAAFDTRAPRRREPRGEGLRSRSPRRTSAITAAEVAGFPLAQVAARQAAPARRWCESRVGDRRGRPAARAAVTPLLGDRDRTHRGRLGRHDQAETRPVRRLGWPRRRGASVEKLGLARLRAILSGTAKEAPDRTGRRRTRRWKARSPPVATVDKLHRAIVRDLGKLCRENFVNF